MSAPLLQVEGLTKIYRQGRFPARETFRLEADFKIAEPQIVGVMGPNGSGKTTLFELITGSNLPTAGTVHCAGQNIHRVRYRERDRLAIHYHQSYQVRHFKKTAPAFLLERALTDYPVIHLFDEPQFNRQDGYIGFMLDFFRRLRDDGRLVFLCVHPQERYHLSIMQEVCEQFMFIRKGRLARMPSCKAMMENDEVRAYLGALAEG